jgi:hypothetical protein
MGNLPEKMFSISTKFPVIASNNPKINGKMGFTIEDKALVINN